MLAGGTHRIQRLGGHSEMEVEALSTKPSFRHSQLNLQIINIALALTPWPRLGAACSKATQTVEMN